MPSLPRLSVCIPTFQRPQLLARAVRSALENGLADIEVIVSDDASDTAVRDWVASLGDARVKYYAHDAAGIAANWTNAVSKASASYVMKLDDDDYLRPGFLPSTCAFLDVHPDVAIVFTAHVAQYQSGREVPLIDLDFFKGRDVVNGYEYACALLLNQGYPLNHKSTGVFRRDLARQIGYFDRIGIDVFWTVAMASLGNVGYIAEPLFVYCVDSGNNEGMGWRPLRMTMESVQALFTLESFRSRPEWAAIRETAIRRMRVAIPMLYVSAAFAHRGRRAGWQMAVRLAREFPDVKLNRLYWPTVCLLSFMNPRLYNTLQSYYRRKEWPRRILNRISACFVRR